MIPDTPFLVITGPTASGKSALAGLLFRSGLPVELVNADAFQMYRGLDIGTAKPDAEERSFFPHHIFDVLDPSETCDVGRWAVLAESSIADIARRGNLPVVCGGSIFYLRHLLMGMPEAPPSDPAVRTALEKRLAVQGSADLHAELARVDPVSAGRIHPNDAYRITRALEVHEISGHPLSSFRMTTGEVNPNVRTVGLVPSSEMLQSRIRERTALMREKGLDSEVDDLAARGYGPSAPAMRAIGYREFFDDLGKMRQDRDPVWEEIRAHTWQYARRQRNFLRDLPEIQIVDPSGEIDAIIGELAAWWGRTAPRQSQSG